MTELREKVARVIEAAQAYFDGYCQDEAADDALDLVGCSEDQHLAAKDLGEALDGVSLDQVLNLIGGDGWKPDWRHIKRGSDYQVVGMGAVQSDVPLNDMDVVVIYRDQAGMFWARRREEFFDGRFEEIAALPPPPASS